MKLLQAAEAYANVALPYEERSDFLYPLVGRLPRLVCDDDEHRVRYEFAFAVVEGNLEPVSITMTARTSGVSSAEIRSVPLREAIKRVRTLWGPRRADDWAAVEVGARERERQTWSRRRLAELARDYVARLDAGDPQPVLTLARGNRKKARHLRNRIADARREGLLTPPPEGRFRAGGELTPEARRLLEEA
jgi:hypothetical protein